MPDILDFKVATGFLLKRVVKAFQTEMARALRKKTGPHRAVYNESALVLCISDGTLDRWLHIGCGNLRDREWYFLLLQEDTNPTRLDGDISRAHGFVGIRAFQATCVVRKYVG